jgi:hypothetical protein
MKERFIKYLIRTLRDYLWRNGKSAVLVLGGSKRLYETIMSDFIKEETPSWTDITPPFLTTIDDFWLSPEGIAIIESGGAFWKADLYDAELNWVSVLYSKYYASGE